MRAMAKFGLAFFLLLGLLLSCSSSSSKFQVKRVLDGDTIELADGERVRYIGINTPEIDHPPKGAEFFGHEAAEVNRKLVEGKQVRLEFDVQQRDRYGRLLAYVYVDSIFVNAELVKRGYAYAYTYPPNVKHADLFVKLQREAREAGQGLWGARKPHQVVDHQEAGKYIGQYLTVRGRVLRTTRRDKLIYLNFGPNYRTDFTVVIFKTYLPNFTAQGIEPTSFYRGRTVEVTGTIKEYNGPEIIARDPSQIRVVKEISIY